jgi:phenolic acid decarboxylase
VKTSKDSFLQNMTGLLEYGRCYINTHFQKKSVLEQARETFNYKTIDKLNEILKVQHLGVNEEDVVDDINDSPRV